MVRNARHARRTASKFLLHLFIYTFLLLAPQHLFAQQNAVGADGLTFQQRKQNWLNSVPDPNASGLDCRGGDYEGDEYCEYRKYLFAWLEKGIYDGNGGTVSQTIQDFVGQYWTIGTGLQAQVCYAVMILLEYGGEYGNGLISSDDEFAIKERYRIDISNSGMFSRRNPNKQVYAMVGTYLYTNFFDSSLEFPTYGYPTYVNANDVDNSYVQSWEDFSYNGRSYEFGEGPYNARQLSSDYLHYVMDAWYVGKRSPFGQREFDSPNYARAFPSAMVFLWQQAEDALMKRKAKMAADLAMLDAVLDYSANAWGGSWGRAQYMFTSMDTFFPFFQWWGLNDVIDRRWTITINFLTDYSPPAAIVDAGVLNDEPDQYWHFHKEYNEWLLHQQGYGKWNFVTKFYTLGSNVGFSKRGWQLVVRDPSSSTSYIRLWVNEDAQEPDAWFQGSYLGTNGKQFRNAMFADIGATPHLWETNHDASWDRNESDSGWQFKKLDKTMVAVKLSSVTAAVEVAIEGVDYANWTEFKNAVKNNAELTDSYFVTSKNARIESGDNCGLNQPGDCNFPFERMETVDHRGNVMLSWNNNVMTVSRHGETVTYDFNNWTFQESPASPDSNPPTPPEGIVAEPVGN